MDTTKFIKRVAVVPRAGTWIETLIQLLHWLALKSSFPVRERGLKQTLYRPLCNSHPASFPVRERGLKLFLWMEYSANLRSFPVRERGLKLEFKIQLTVLRQRRSPCGNVD